MNAYILRIKGCEYLANPETHEFQTFYEVEVLGGEKRGTESVREKVEAKASTPQPRFNAKAKG